MRLQAGPRLVSIRLQSGDFSPERCRPFVGEPEVATQATVDDLIAVQFHPALLSEPFKGGVQRGDLELEATPR